MNIYLSEDEQVQKIKEWVKKNGIVVICGIAVFFAANFGWRYWQQYRERQNIQASSLYEQLIAAQITHRYDDVKLYAQRLRDDYARTPYASLASLMAARDATIKKDLSIVEQDLQWVIDHAKSKAFKQIARIRLARVFMEDQQSQKALTILEVIEDKAYLAKIYEVKGDVYLSTEDKKLALQEYQKAIEFAGSNSVIKSIIEMKIQQL
jgi:predicted negative regulator of RcsB-dependent stress response